MAETPKGFASAPDNTPANMPVCGVVAVSILCCLDHNTAFELVKQAGNKKGYWKGHTYDSDRAKVLDAHGVRRVYYVYGIGQTVEKFIATTKPGKVYLCGVHRHVFVVLNGKVYDQTYPNGVPVTYSWFRRRKLDSVEEIVSGPFIESLKE